MSLPLLPNLPHRHWLEPAKGHERDSVAGSGNPYFFVIEGTSLTLLKGRVKAVLVGATTAHSRNLPPNKTILQHQKGIVDDQKRGSNRFLDVWDVRASS
jgi:hypothetical protein